MAEFINTADIIGDDEMCDQIIQRTVTEYKENRVTKVGQFAFYGCTELATVDIPNVTSIGSNAFQNCTTLSSLDLPNVTTIAGNFVSGVSAELSLPRLTEVPGQGFSGYKGSRLTLPAVTSIDRYGFNTTGTLRYLDLPACTSIGSYAFQSVKLETLILRSLTICTTANISNWGTTPYIYVPSALINSYKAATNWSNYADYIRPLEDYTVDGTVTGDFDETKI